MAKRLQRRYTPTRARRLATQARLLWAEMICIAQKARRLAENHDADPISQQRIELRTIEIVLRGYSPEHRLWASLRQACVDRDEDNSLFRFMSEVREILTSRLDRIDSEIARVAKGDMFSDFVMTVDEYFGVHFCPALKLLREVYSDWKKVSVLLDFIDYEGPGTTDGLADEDRTLAIIEARTQERRRAMSLDRDRPAAAGG